MKKIIIISENQLRSILQKKLLTEAASLDKIINALSKDVKEHNLNQSELADLIMADPTAVTNARGQFVGKYWKWIYSQYKQGNLKVGDIPELETALTTYNINKSQINKPIDSFNTLDELVEVIADYNDSFKATRTLSKGEQELEKVYEDQYVTVYIPHTWEAARKIGGDTHWCTASSSDKYFNHYLNSYGGEYYDIIRKSDGAKFQLHVESEQFMDSDDGPVTFASVFNSRKEMKGLVNFLKGRGKVVGKWVPKTWFYEVQAKLDAGEELKDIFDWYERYAFEDTMVVELNGKWNFINKEGKIISEKWFDEAFAFQEGFGRVKLDKKWNFINKEGKIISEKWFDYCYLFDSSKYLDCAKVEIGDNVNLLKKDGTLVSETWFDNMGGEDKQNGLVIVLLNGRYNFLKLSDGGLLSMWFLNVSVFRHGISIVEADNGKQNAINLKGEILSPHKWFDFLTKFTNEGAYFGTHKKGGGKEYYKVNEHGIVSKITDQ